LRERGVDITLIDVRTPKEYNQGYIPGAINIPLNKIQEINNFHYKGMVILYCTVGVRSMKAKKILAGKGIKNILDLEGGINSWIKNGGSYDVPKKHSGVNEPKDSQIYSDYPTEYIIPKGVCEQGIPPAMIISK